jgi:hypothetical protein
MFRFGMVPSYLFATTSYIRLHLRHNLPVMKRIRSFKPHDALVVHVDAQSLGEFMYRSQVPGQEVFIPMQVVA